MDKKKEIEDLTGRTFGRWMVIGRAPDRKDKHNRTLIYWVCKCECGTLREVSERELKRGRSKSCGCLKKELKEPENLVGRRFGRWIVIERGKDRYDKNGHILRTWICRCDCGTVKEVFESSLRYNISQSCGCLQKEIVSKTSGKRDEMISKKFGRLLVLKEAYIKNGQIYWYCICDCGNYVTVSGASLRSGATQSCGCYNKERTKETQKLLRKYNKYDLNGLYGIGYTDKGVAFTFDLEDYEKIYPYLWYEKEDGYIVAHNRDNNGHIRLNRLVMDVQNEDPIAIRVDHKNHDLKNNQKYNLRVSTNQENSFNHKLFDTNKSGVSGVRLDEERNKWIAEITYNYKTIHLGRFNTKEEAVKVRKEAEEKYFGEWSYDNSQVI